MIAVLLRYWWAGVIAALLVALGAQEIRISHLRVDVATLKQTAADLKAEREYVAEQHAKHISELERKHARDQNTLEAHYTQQVADLAHRRAAAAADADRLRNAIHQYAASGDLRGASADPTAAERGADRLDRLAALLAEGVGLLEEGRGLVEQRDYEVARLLAQIKLDRGTCQDANKSTSGSGLGLAIPNKSSSSGGLANPNRSSPSGLASTSGP